MKRSTVSGLLAVCLIVSGGAVAQPTVQAGFSPEGSALQLVLNTIDTAQESIRLMGYSFTSPEVTRALIQAKQRGVDVKAVLDWKANSTKGSAGVAASWVFHGRYFSCDKKRSGGDFGGGPIRWCQRLADFCKYHFASSLGYGHVSLCHGLDSRDEDL